MLRLFFRVAPWVALMSCGAPRTNTASPAASECPAETIVPTLEAARTLSSTPGGPNAWVEARVTWPIPATSDYRLLLDGREIPIVRKKSIGARAPGDRTMDPTEGRLIGRDSRAKPTPSGHGDIVGFRVPAATSAGKHQLVVRTCQPKEPEGITLDVVAAPAPVINTLRSVRGETWSVLYIEGANLSDVEELVLVGEDEAVTTVPVVTMVDAEHAHATLERTGTFEVFVRSKTGGLGGGPPSGVVTVR